jgi:hypothetical protein
MKEAILSLSRAALLLASVSVNAGAGGAITLETRVVHQIEMGEVTWHDVHSKLGAFSFVPPADWQLQARPAEGRLSLRSPDLLTTIEIRFNGSDAGLATTNRAEALRGGLAGAYPGAVIEEEFPCHTSASPGQAFDLRWKPAKEVEMAARVVLLSCPGGTIEFHLLARPEKIAGSYNLFGALLTSFGRQPFDSHSLPPRQGA